ncbi:MAG: hypothetical protein ACQESZ_01410 [Bacteroidota bacterium]
MKKITTMVFTIFMLLTVLSSNVKAQDDWTLYKEVNGIQIFQKPTECHDVANGLHQEIILLKFINTTSEDMEISWSLEAWYDGNCATCHDPDDEEYQFSLAIKGGETISGVCDIQQGNTLRIFKGFLDKEGTSTLTRFELNNIRANPL